MQILTKSQNAFFCHAFLKNSLKLKVFKDMFVLHEWMHLANAIPKWYCELMYLENDLNILTSGGRLV